MQCIALEDNSTDGSGEKLALSVTLLVVPVPQDGTRKVYSSVCMNTAWNKQTECNLCQENGKEECIRVSSAVLSLHSTSLSAKTAGFLVPLYGDDQADKQAIGQIQEDAKDFSNRLNLLNNKVIIKLTFGKKGTHYEAPLFAESHHTNSFEILREEQALVENKNNR
ncbi:hypothetical protein Anapl_14081 [Anas platyrhynchos]|uniref:Uncharacterized protein n=1 Tax=Anas platyrhynchos TaxID=8839 RepID=R0JY93_ANAPL|nr:hypothetical protein Anapl_14081 [Anas platyrhynchos]